MSSFQRLDLAPLSPERPFQRPVMSRDEPQSAPSDLAMLDGQLHLEGWGPVHVALTDDAIIWERDKRGKSSKKGPGVSLNCFPKSERSRGQKSLPLNNVFAVEIAGPGSIAAHSRLTGKVDKICGLAPQLNRSDDGGQVRLRAAADADPFPGQFIVHTFRKMKDSSVWEPRQRVFGHAEVEVCNAWVTKIQAALSADVKRPKSLLVLVNPFGGKRQAVQTWERIAPLFALAGAKCEVVKTKSVGHAFNLMDQASDGELQSWDGIVVVGGDGLFNEVLNGLLIGRHCAPPPVVPQRSVSAEEGGEAKSAAEQGTKKSGYQQLRPTTSGVPPVVSTEATPDPVPGPNRPEVHRSSSHVRHGHRRANSSGVVIPTSFDAEDPLLAPGMLSLASVTVDKNRAVVSVTATIGIRNPDAQSAGGEAFSDASPATASATATVTAEVLDYEMQASTPDGKAGDGGKDKARVSIDGPVTSNLLGTLPPDHPAAAAAIAAAARAAEAAAIAAARSRASSPFSPAVTSYGVNPEPLTLPAALTPVQTQTETLEAPKEPVPPPSLNTPVGIEPLQIPSPTNPMVTAAVGPFNPSKLPTIHSGFVTEDALQSAARLGLNEATTILTPRGGSAVLERFEEGTAEAVERQEASIIEGILPPGALQKWPLVGKKIRIGLIPAGSTDTVAVSTNGARDPITAALHILLGDRLPLDVVRVTAWDYQHEGGRPDPDHVEMANYGRAPSEQHRGRGSGHLHTEHEDPRRPHVRYAASFAGYGFYGDVMRESELYRWMGPARYDYAGLRTFLRHRTYEAEITYLERGKTFDPSGTTSKPGHRRSNSRVVCRVACHVCSKAGDEEREAEAVGTTDLVGEYKPKALWRTLRGEYHSVAGAVMACRNDKAPDGISTFAHLSDGRMDLILIKDCSRLEYLRQLIRLARKGADPFDLPFVETHKTSQFHFRSLGQQSTWNVDGELLKARELSAQVFRGLVDIFARGPEA
ncbi:Ceramide kinase [Klebsormidium nitens]|uniref:Ceramide kinase n=1 Tax=Klebsormidium nitens TaxID=105231 RepID=A0A1Y1IE64_KLENI|nr:Ceramide kinase [Klebsormidium nitens]|eukprot:GAQ89220.1 Ceramide kinase [Klebsormidium nitens]